MGRKRPALTGRTFGRLTVLGPIEANGVLQAWHCRCACGTEKTVATISLTSGRTRSCGCLHAEYLRTRERPATFRRQGRDLTGRTVGRLTVVKLGPPQGRHRAWLCRCECGTEIVVTQCNLVRKNTTSCGCRRRESGEELAAAANARTYPRRCRRCDTPFLGVYKQWFCSSTCAHRYHTERKWPRVSLHCPVCNTNFQGRADRVYCSERCQRTAANRRIYQDRHGSLTDQTSTITQAIQDRNPEPQPEGETSS